MRRRTRIVWVATLDRQLAESEAIQRAMNGGARWARVTAAERIEDPATGDGVWEIVLRVPRRRSR